MQYKLAELLLRRKELQERLQVISQIKKSDIYEVKVTRKAAHEGVDDIVASVPKLDLKEVTAEMDFYARQLRLTDAAIQQTNWTTEVEVPSDVMKEYGE